MTTTLHPHSRRRLDGVVRRGFHALRRKKSAHAYYNRILNAVRANSTLLQPTARGAWEDDIVGALVRIAVRHRHFVREPETWPGGEGNPLRLLGSVAEHLLADYPVPPILAQAWLGPPSEERWALQRWFIEHGAGRPFRSLDGVPLPLTRAMEHHFLESPPHLSLCAALRRAEVLGLGAPPALADVVVGTVLGQRLDEHAFWRPILRFLVDHRDELTAHRTVAIIETIDRLCSHLRTLDGGQLRPERLIRGRTPETLERTLCELVPPPAPPCEPPTRRQWSPTGVAGWVSYAPGRSVVAWHIVELLAAVELFKEGRTMRHCVGSYVGRCVRGTSRIWSVREQHGDGQPESRATIEVSPRHRCIIQIRGRRNARPPDTVLSMIYAWAKSEGLTVTSCAAGAA